MRAAVLIFALTFLAAPGLTQSVGAAGYRLKVDNRELIVSDGKKKHRLPADDLIDAERATEARLLFVDRKGEHTYLVADVAGPSRIRHRDRQCGAGKSRCGGAGRCAADVRGVHRAAQQGA